MERWLTTRSRFGSSSRWKVTKVDRMARVPCVSCVAVSAVRTCSQIANTAAAVSYGVRHGLRSATRMVSSEKGTPVSCSACTTSCPCINVKLGDTDGRKPTRIVRRRYAPATPAATRKSPLSLVSARAATLSRISSIRTTTPGIGAPDWSVAVPRTICAVASAGTARSNAMLGTT
jgi:hypothetical protein